MRKLLYIPVFLFTLSSCEECRNTNPILNEQRSDTREYKLALAHEINNIDHRALVYRVDTFDRSKNILHVDVNGPGLCCDLPLVVNDWSKMQEVERGNPECEYARLVGLTFHTKTDRNGIFFEYRDMIRLEKIKYEVIEVDSISEKAIDSANEREIRNKREAIENRNSSATHTKQPNHDKQRNSH